jgi:hypothetical protein
VTAGDVPDEARAAAFIHTGSPESVTVAEIDGAGHTAGLDVDPERWTELVTGFLDSALEIEATGR